jgi:hypothetical protein
MIMGLPHTPEKSNELFMPSHLPPYKLNNNVPRVYCPFAFNPPGHNKKKCNYNLMYANMEREREIQNLVDSSIADKMSLGFEPMRGLYNFEVILIECPLSTKKRKQEGIMPLS